MIRLLSFLVLLGASAIVLADPLYKWIESDGSITFSVKPPAAGISYETVNTQSPQQPPNSTTSGSAQSGQVPDLQQALPASVKASEPTQRVAPQQDIQSSSQPGVQRSMAKQSDMRSNYIENQTSSVMGATAKSTNGKNRDSPARTAASGAKNRKQRQCEDLKKRVISLESRLRTRLTPEDMDNTVVHMARYQRSYDQHCVQ